MLITELFVVDIINHYFSGNHFILPQPFQTLAWDRAFPFILEFVILSSHEWTLWANLHFLLNNHLVVQYLNQINSRNSHFPNFQFVALFDHFALWACAVINFFTLCSVSASWKGGDWRRREAESQLRQEVDACFPRKAWTNWESEFDKAELNFLFLRLGGTPGWMKRESGADFFPASRGWKVYILWKIE